MASHHDRSADAEWREIVSRYNTPDRARSIGQLTSTLVLYAALFYAMYRCLDVSVWLTLALSVPTAGVLVRLFIIFHDCGHGSFFSSRRWCDAVGIALGILVFTPYRQWTADHATHHRTVGDLDRRGTGDVWTMTVAEYKASSRGRRLLYRFFRNPLFLFGIGSFLMFALLHRAQSRRSTPRDKLSVYATDLALAGLAVLLCLLMGVRAYLLVQLPVLFISSAAGVWLFYVQHQFDGVVWSRNADWDYRTVALHGSSFYRLPRVLRWFSGNIGYHHIHHLSPRIPNYKLAACHAENPLFREAPVVTVGSSLRSLFLRLWDEQRGKLVGFRGLASR